MMMMIDLEMMMNLETDITEARPVQANVFHHCDTGVETRNCNGNTALQASGTKTELKQLWCKQTRPVEQP